MEDTFVFYPTFLRQIECIKNDAIKACVYRAVAEYGCYGTEPDFSDIDPTGILEGSFSAIKFAIDESKSKRENIRKRRAEAGRIGGLKSKPKQTEAKANKRSLNVNGNVNGNVNNSSTNVEEEKPKRSTRFVAPSLDEVKTFFSKNNFTSDAERFFDYYNANGWTQGKGKLIKNWQAAARNWERRQSEFEPKAKIAATPTPKPPTAADYDEDEDEAFISKDR